MMKNCITSTALLLLAATSTGALASSLTIGNGSGVPGGTATTTLTYTAASPFVQGADITITYDATQLTPVLTNCLSGLNALANTGTFNGSTCTDSTPAGTITISILADSPGASDPVHVLFNSGTLGSIDWTIDAGVTPPATFPLDGTTAAGGSGYTDPADGLSLVEIDSTNFPVTDGEISVTDTPPTQCALVITTSSPLDFTATPQTLPATLENDGDGDCTGIDPTVSGTGYTLALTTDPAYTCPASPFTLTPADAPCNVAITFNGTLGDDGELSVASNDPASPDPLALTSTDNGGGTQCTLSVTVPTFTMSPQTLQATVNNTGDGDCTSIAPTVTGTGYALDATTTTCGTTLAPTDVPCVIGITFSGTVGIDDGELSVASNDPASPTVDDLTSSATAPVAIPTLSQWSMILVGSVLALLAMVGMRRKEG